jgi:hypothetical protein
MGCSRLSMRTSPCLLSCPATNPKGNPHESDDDADQGCIEISHLMEVIKLVEVPALQGRNDNFDNPPTEEQ